MLYCYYKQLKQSELWPKQHWIRWQKNYFLYNNLYSSSLFYDLLVFRTHTGNKGGLDFRQRSCIKNVTMKIKGSGSRMAASCRLDDTIKFNCATYDTLDAVDMFLSSETEPFLLADFTSIKNILPWIVSWLTTCHFLKWGDSLSVFFFFCFLTKDKILSGVRLD